MPGDAFNLSRAISDIRANKDRSARDADGIQVRDTSATDITPKAAPGPSAADALRGERTGSEGERSFGAPVDAANKSSASDEAATRAAIRAKIESLSKRQRTDSSN